MTIHKPSQRANVFMALFQASTQQLPESTLDALDALLEKAMEADMKCVNTEPAEDDLPVDDRFFPAW